MSFDYDAIKIVYFDDGRSVRITLCNGKMDLDIYNTREGNLAYCEYNFSDISIANMSKFADVLKEFCDKYKV